MLDETDVAAVRLPVALRGYRFAETDLLLDRLADELRERDAEIARLKELRSPYHVAAERAARSDATDDSAGADAGVAGDGADGANGTRPSGAVDLGKRDDDG